MKTELIEKFKALPDELIHYIVNYTDIVVYRHGKYMNRLSKEDDRYKILMSIPKPITLSNRHYLLNLGTRKNKSNIKYSLCYYIRSEIILNIHILEDDIDGFDKYTITKSYSRYIFDANNNWHKIIDYTM